MDNTLLRLAATLVIASIVVTAFNFAAVVFEPVAFTPFAIAISWPFQEALRTRMPN